MQYDWLHLLVFRLNRSQSRSRKQFFAFFSQLARWSWIHLCPQRTLCPVFLYLDMSIATFYLTSLFPSNITGRLICSQPRELDLPFPLSPILQPLWLIYFLVLVAGSWFKSILSLQPTIEKKHSFRYSQWQFPQQHALAIKTKGVDQNCPGEIQ